MVYMYMLAIIIVFIILQGMTVTVIIKNLLAKFCKSPLYIPGWSGPQRELEGPRAKYM